MPRLSTVQQEAMATWWNLAVDAASRGLLSTDLTAAAADLARNVYGRSLAFAESQALATLYGYARRMANAASELGGAAPSAVLDSSMMAIPPWARDEQVMNTTPIWHVTFQFTYLDQAGNVQTDFRTDVFDMTLAETVAELQADVEADAQFMADKYNVTLVSVKLHSILAV